MVYRTYLSGFQSSSDSVAHPDRARSRPEKGKSWRTMSDLRRCPQDGRSPPHADGLRRHTHAAGRPALSATNGFRPSAPRSPYASRPWGARSCRRSRRDRTAVWYFEGGRRPAPGQTGITGVLCGMRTAAEGRRLRAQRPPAARRMPRSPRGRGPAGSRAREAGPWSVRDWYDPALGRPGQSAPNRFAPQARLRELYSTPGLRRGPSMRGPWPRGGTVP